MSATMVPPAARGDPSLGELPTSAQLARADVGQVYELCRTSTGGLSVPEAADRLARFGPNRIEETGRRGLASRLLANFTHLMAMLLWVGGLVAFVAGLPALGVAVWLVNLVNGAFSFLQEHRAERATEALRELLPSYARVLRDGEERQIPAEELVPGDVMLLGEGDRISADGRLVDEHELRVDQSTLTGESHPSRRSSRPTSVEGTSPAERRNSVFAGTSVASGRGKAVVTATGMGSEFGQLAGMTQGMLADRSPLQAELDRLSKVVAVIAVGTGMAFFVLAQALTPMSLTRGLVFALGMIVAFVPEGLLPTVTLALAMGTQRMAKRNALVKRLSAVEALGSTTVICTDKTGTITQNAMTVTQIRLESGRVELTGVGYDPDGELRAEGRRLEQVEGDLRDLLLAAALANDAQLRPPSGDSDRWSYSGDPTEVALKVAARKAGIDLDAEGERRPRLGEAPFDSNRRRMSTLHRDGSGAALFLKGSPLDVLALCSSVRLNGDDEPLDEATRRGVVDAVDAYGRDALRVLAVATRRWTDPPAAAPAVLETDLVLLGLVAMLDPPRPGVQEAVAVCRRAGIRILMMTGDYGLTAESIARRVGLVQGEDVQVVNGDELDELDDAALATLLDGQVVLARSTPAHKLRVVRCLQATGEVVAVTGDGVNDAPALKQADIGVAMGASGTDVAREAADMVLLDDNFASIVSAVEEGRAVYANIAKFTGYIFTSNTPEAVPFVVFGLTGGRVPPALDVMHILAIDLGTDLLPALALGAEHPEPGVMDRPPRPRDQHLVTRPLLVRSYLWLGPIQAAIVMAAFYAQYWYSGYGGRWLDLPGTGPVYASATAAALAAVVATQVGNLLAHRTERQSIRSAGLFSNHLIWWGIATEALVIAAIVYLPPLQALVGTSPFPAAGWLLLAAVSPVLLVVDELRKARLRRADLEERSAP